jgi:hypothetical protein
MKKYLMVFLAVMLLSTAASAQSQGYLGLFADVDHTTWCGSAASIPGSFTMYIYMLPRADGSGCAEFLLVPPADPTIIIGSATPNPDNSIILGDPLMGVSFCYTVCQYGWTIVYTILVIDTAGNQNMIQLAPHPTAGGPNLTECPDPRPVYPAVIFNNLYINYTDGVDPECSETATATRTWGAIKSLYVE